MPPFYEFSKSLHMHRDTGTDTIMSGVLTNHGAFPGLRLLSEPVTYETWYEAATIVLMVVDTVFAVFVGLDVVGYGLGLPWFQFGFSLGIAVLHSLMFAVAMVAYQRERVASFTYRWVLSMLVNSGLAWTMFVFFAVWIRHFGGASVTNSNGLGLVSWISVNALAVTMFMARMVVLAMVCGMYYSHLRTMELVDYGIRASRMAHRTSLLSYLHQQPQKNSLTKHVRFV